MRSSNDEFEDDWAGRAGVRLDARGHRARLGLLHVGDAFRHDLGFVRRRGVGTLFGRYARVLRPRNSSGLVREYAVGAEMESTMDDRYASQLTRVGSVNYEMLFADGAELRTWGASTFERLSAPFRIGGDVSVPAGDYEFENVGIEFRSNRSAVLSGSVEASAGEFWSGQQQLISGALRWRMNAHVAASTTLSRTSVTLPEGTFNGGLVGVRLDWSLTPRMFLNAFVQYNGETDLWLSNIRFNLIHRPLSDVYIVWNETRAPDATRRALLLKYTHLIAF